MKVDTYIQFKWPDRLRTAVLMLAVSAQLAGAQEALTLKECLARAKQQNPEVTAAQKTYEQTKFLHEASESDFYPQISASISDNKNSSSSSELLDSAPPQTANTNVTTNTYSAKLTVTQNLFAGFHDKYSSQQSSASAAAARAEVDQSFVDLLYNVREAFFTQLYQQELVALSTKVVRRRQDNLRLVALRFEAGRENKGSYLISKAALSGAEADLKKAQRGLLTAQRQLALLIDEPQFEILKVKGTFAANLPPVKPDFAAMALIVPSYQQALAQAKAAKASVDVARSALYPTVDAVGNVNRMGGSWPPRTDSYSVGLAISLPLYSGGSGLANISAAAASSGASEASLESVRRKSIIDLTNSFVALNDAVDNLKVQIELEEASVVRAQILGRQYDLGLTSFQDWDTVENNLIEAEKSTLTARESAALAEDAWNKATGKGINDDKE